MKELRLTTGVAAVLLVGACGQTSDEPDNGWTTDRDTAVCVDQQGQRVPDDKCPRQQQAVAAGHGGGVSPFLWYYLGRSSALPYYGERVTGGSFAPGAGRTYFRAPPATAVARGGFGGSARAFGSARG